MVSGEYWYVMSQQHAEARQRERDAVASLEGAKASVSTTLEAKAETGKKAKDQQIDASFSQTRAQLVATIVSMCGGGGGGRGGGGGGAAGAGAAGAGAGGSGALSPPPGTTGNAPNSATNFILANLGIVGALIRGDWKEALLQQVPLVNAVSTASRAGESKDGSGVASPAQRARDLPQDVLLDFPASLDRDGAQQAEREERALEESAGAAEDRWRRRLARRKRDREEARATEDLLLRAQQNTVSLA